MIDESAIRIRFKALGAGLDERARRLFAAAEARAAGGGGVRKLHVGHRRARFAAWNRSSAIEE
jgi:hypothetical protein